MSTLLGGERPGANYSNMRLHAIPARNSGTPKFAMKTRQTFYLHHQAHADLPTPVLRELVPLACYQSPLFAHQQHGHQGRGHGPATGSLAELAGPEADHVEVPGSHARVSEEPPPASLPPVRPSEGCVWCAQWPDPCQVAPSSTMAFPPSWARGAMSSTTRWMAT